MKPSELALAHGLAHTRALLRGWNARPWAVVGRWTGGALAIAALLLGVVLAGV